jgi:hypothetical protein
MDRRIQVLFALANKVCSSYPLDVTIVLYNAEDKGSTVFRSSRPTTLACPFVRFKFPLSILITADVKDFASCLDESRPRFDRDSVQISIERSNDTTDKRPVSTGTGDWHLA